MTSEPTPEKPSYLGLLLRFKALEHDMRGTCTVLDSMTSECKEYRERAFLLQNEVDALQRKLKDEEMRGYELERALEEVNPRSPNRFKVGDRVFVRTDKHAGYSKVWVVKLHIGHTDTSVLYSTDFGDAIHSTNVYATAAEAFGE